MKLESSIKKILVQNINRTLATKLSADDLQLDFPPDTKMGDYALPCFDIAKQLGQNPADIAKQLAEQFQTGDIIQEVKNLGPYLNLFLESNKFVATALAEISKTKNFGHNSVGKGKKILIEFSGINTNKPQHIGHVRNNCIGQAMVNILRANSYKVIATNISNDRGIHIVKSMLAWQEYGKGETPESSGVKGDHLVGKYYVMFGQHLAKDRAKYLKANNINLSELDNFSRRQVEDNFLNQSWLMTKAREMLIAWEKGDKKVRELWSMMNSWVYDGYDETYAELGIEFDHTDYESDTYILGKKMVATGLKKGIFTKRDDGSVWIDLRDVGLDKKLLLRNDGTSVYMTQDLGTAERRYRKFKFDKLIYVVASEQDYHFKVLFNILQKMGYKWANDLFHLSYGMITMPDGRLKSREGQTADADAIISDMKNRAQAVMAQARKQVEISDKQRKETINMVGLGALKFFMLGTNPQKDISFDPENSISFDGYTGPFVQYTHARIANLLAKAGQIKNINTTNIELDDDEKRLMLQITRYPQIVAEAANTYNPSLIAQYIFSLAKVFNNFYQHNPVIKAESDELKQLRLQIVTITKDVLADGLALLGIEAPESM